MKSPRAAAFFPLLTLFIASLNPAFGRAAAPAPLDWPQVTNKAKPWARWWWLGNIGTDADFSSEMQKYAQAGLGGLEITPIYGVRGEEARFVRYLTPQWMQRLEYVLDEGQRLGLGLDMDNGNGWPFGGPWVGPEDAAKYVARRSYSLKAGERLTEPVTFLQQPIVSTAGPRKVTAAELMEPLSVNADLQDLALFQVRHEKPLPLVTLMACSDRGQRLDLTAKVGAGGQLDWTAPEGNWTLYALFQGWHGKLVERAGPGAEGFVIDHFSGAALRDYLRPFEAAYAGRNVNRLRAYFCDSYEVDDSQGESDWTPRFLKEFARRRGYDLRQQLPAFFGRDTEEMNARVISDHRETISDLMLEEFAHNWSSWAATHGALVRYQAHGSPANIIDLYAASGIPETEGRDPLSMKLASSAAHLTGKPLASAETCTWLGEHFSSTLADVKQRVDLTFLGGVNHIVYHGTAFSPPGEPWPGFHFYAAAEFDPSNPFWSDFGALNAYVARIQSFLQATKPANDVLLYYPIHDRWAERGDGTMPHFSGPQGTTAQAAGQLLLDRGYSFDFVSDHLLADVKCADSVLTAGGNRYQAILVPATRLMPLPTLEKLVALARAGGTILIQKNPPADVPGFGELEARRVRFQRLLAVIGSPAADAGGVATAQVGKGRVLIADDPERLLARAGVGRMSVVDQGLAFERRAHEGGDVLFLLNRGRAPFAGWVRLSAGTKSAAIFDPMTSDRGVAAVRTAPDGATEAWIQLAQDDSCLVKTFTAAIEGPAFAYWKERGEAHPLGGPWQVRFVAGGPELPAAAEVKELKSWTDFGGEAVKAISGTAVYMIQFAHPAGAAAAWRLDLGRVAESARVTLNGQEIGALIKAPFQLVIPADQLREQNTLEIAVSNLGANRIADLDRRGVKWKRFYNANYPAHLRESRGADGMFSAARWTPRPSGLIGPVTLTPLAILTPGAKE
jgi:hypothetical protein